MLKIVDEPLKIGGYIVEKTLITSEGYYGVCVFNATGHRCGYVGVPEDHPLYGVGYNAPELSSIEVHGRLNYARQLYIPVELDGSEYWFFGFDCAHGGDSPDVDAAKQYGFSLRQGLNPGTVRTLEFVEAEVLKLSAQLTPQAIMQAKMEGPDE